ncbi:MAG: hypothetical protein PHH36_01215 [Sideroxydans sp.]|nr:hypothetical protein [Sideroxydans sp.]
MNARRFAVAVLAIFIFALVWNGFVHMVLLKEAGLALVGIARPAAERNMALGLLLTAGIATLFVYSYVSFVRTPGVRRALGHGVFFALLAGLLVDLNQFFLYPLPGSLAVAWFLFGCIEFCIYGVLVSWIYPIAAPPVAPRAASQAARAGL